MAAYEIFNDVISYVENSNLNYFINKTPFSATISIKSSLIKRHETAPEPGIKFKDSDYKDNLMEENAMLKEKLKFAEKAADEMKEVIEVKKRLESARAVDKEIIKDLEDQIAGFRSEILTVKRDKNKTSQKYKALEEEFALTEENRNNLKEENKDLENKVKTKNKLVADKTSECQQLINDKVKLKERLENALSELNAVKKEKDTVNNNELKLKCSMCDSDFVQAVDLRKHVRSNHCKDQVSQTRTFNKIVSTQTEENIETCEYPCFYCDNVITSIEDLMQHKGDCPVYQDKCDQCDAKFRYRSDLIDHYKTKHPEMSLVWCDFCQAGFEGLEELQGHIRIEHRNYLPG